MGARDLNARQVLVFAVLALAVVTALDLVDGHFGFVFSLGFVLIVATAPLAVEPRGLILTAFLPIALLLVAVFVVALVAGDSIVIDRLPESAGVFGRTLAGVIDRGVTLLVGTLAALAAIAARYGLRPEPQP